MITLQSVRLVNFRLIEDSTFTPGQTGITGIFGANGTGKSSFLDGTMWALYGVLPDGVSAENIRREDSEVSEECFVEVTFVHDGQTITVNRSIKNKSNTTVLYVYLNGEQATGPSVKVGQKWITDRLGIDARGFSTAFVVLQKELDTLVTARPAERRALIEKLSGIDKMSKALKFAREILNQERKSLDLLSGDPDDVALAGSIVEEKQSVVLEVEDNLNSLKEQLEAREESARFAYENLLELEDVATEQDALTSKLSALEHRVEFYSKSLEEAEGELSRAEKVKPSDNPEEELAEVDAKLEKVSLEINECRRITQEASNFEARKSSKIESLQTLISNTERNKDSLEETIKAEQELLVEVSVDNSLEEKVAELNASNEELKSRLSRAMGKVADSQTSIGLLNHDDHVSCPTCHQGIENSESIIKNLEEVISDLEEEAAELRRNIEENDGKISELNQAQKEQEHLVRVNSARQDKVIALKESLAGVTAELESHQAELKEARLLSNEVKNPYNLAELEATRESLLLKKQEVLNAKENLERFNNALNKTESIQENLRLLNDEKAGILESLENLEISEGLDDLIANAKQNYSSESAALDSLSNNIAAITTTLLVEKERLLGAQRDYERELSSYNSKLEALKKLEIKSASAEVLDEFRKSQIARIAPELAETATGLISNMTNGKYVEINLDENFTPFVTNSSGKTKSAYTLSGGEISVVALALRIAIGDLITGGTGGLLWLDEVLTAQDAERRASLVETIRSMSDRGRQIVMINHTQEASDVVDKSVRLELYENSSRIVE